MTDYTKLYIDGQWIEPDAFGRLEVIDSTTEAVFATVPEGVAADITRAVFAADYRQSTTPDASFDELLRPERPIAQ